MSAPAPVVTDKRMRSGLAGEVARLYVQGRTHAEIGAALNLTAAQAHKILSELFAAGMPKLKRRRMSEAQLHEIHSAYLRGQSSIRAGAEAIGFTRTAAARRIRAMQQRAGGG